jgi:hypothetical protein
MLDQGSCALQVPAQLDVILYTLVACSPFYPTASRPFGRLYPGADSCIPTPLQDIVTRYATSTGHHVSRRFGWDCHGLPVEYEIDKKLSEYLDHAQQLCSNGIITHDDSTALRAPPAAAGCASGWMNARHASHASGWQCRALARSRTSCLRCRS